MKVRSVGVRRVWDCMLCAYMDRGEDAEEAPSLLSYTLRYVSLVELGTVCRVGLLKLEEIEASHTLGGTVIHT